MLTYLDLVEQWGGIDMKWLEKLTGLDKKRQELEEKELNLLKDKDPKEYATRKKEPWVSVISTHVNETNVKNGFFELDWNNYFIEQLREQGYGLDGDSEEEIVDRWFRELCANVVVDGEMAGTVNTGSLDIQSVKKTNT